MSSMSEKTSDTSQQISQPNLSQDEELEVLQSIYVLGEAKGWNFLQPEQKQKLIENRMIIIPEIGKEQVVFAKKKKWENAKTMADVFMSLLISAFEKALIDNMHYCSKEEWESKNDETKWAVDKLVFYMVFKMKLDEMPEHIYTTWSDEA